MPEKPKFRWCPRCGGKGIVLVIGEGNYLTTDGEKCNPIDCDSCYTRGVIPLQPTIKQKFSRLTERVSRRTSK